MKRIHISRKKTILIAGIAAVSLAAAFIPGGCESSEIPQIQLRQLLKHNEIKEEIL